MKDIFINFFREFGLTLAGAVVISSFVALTLTPMLSTAGRLIISLAMYMGRVGPLTLALAVPPARPSAVEVPQGAMMVR